jgi:nucleoside-diphosphate-sugar epimerase
MYSEPLVVVFGGAGYIGSWTVRELLNEGYRVRAYDNFLFGDAGLAELNHPNLEIIEGDISDVTAVSRAMNGADSVILLASLVGRRFDDIPHARFREVNFLASSVVLDAAVEHGVYRFVFASTDSIYGSQTGVMYETATPEPVSLYSRLKLRMEERVIKEKSRYFHPTALRLATCYGFSPRMRFDLAPNGLIRDAICNNKIVVETQDSCRAFIHVQDAAYAIVLCVKAHVNLISGEVFNVGSKDQNVSIKQIAGIASTVCPWVEVVINDGEPDLVDYRLSCSKIERLLDFNPRWTFEQSMVSLKAMLTEGKFSNPYDLRYHNT